MIKVNIPVSPDEEAYLAVLDRQVEEDRKAAESLVIPGAKILREASEGPLKYLTPIFVDVETTKTDEISIKKMTFREYLARAELLSLAIAVGDTRPRIYFSPTLPGVQAQAKIITPAVIQAMRVLAEDPNNVWVGYNMAFDSRVLVEKCHLPYPKNVWCAMEGAMAAWPELPGGYSLDNCSCRLGLPPEKRKFKINLDELGRLKEKLSTGRIVETVKLRDDVQAEFKAVFQLNGLEFPDMIDLMTFNMILEFYNVQDVVSLQEIYYRQIGRLPEREQNTALRTHQQRRHLLRVEPERLENLIEKLDEAAYAAEMDAQEYLTEEQSRDIFNRDSGALTSLRYLRLRDVINTMQDDPTDDFTSTSLKKLSPVQLARNPTVSAVLEQTTRVGKMLSHKRRSAIFKGVSDVYCELGYARAHTMRFSSPSFAKGLNLHNIPKRDVVIAKPIRQCYMAPSGKVFVRGDLANVEYRVVGFLTECKTVFEMFLHDVFVDPYCATWKAMVGIQINKKDPARQIAKQAVLALGFCMSPTGFAKVLLRAISDKLVTLDDIKAVAAANNWPPPPSYLFSRIIKNLGCSALIATVAYHIHRLFNLAHPEFAQTAEWLVKTVGRVAACAPGSIGIAEAERWLDYSYSLPLAPNRDKIGLEIDHYPFEGKPTIRVRCGYWPATVCWREPEMRCIAGFGEQRGAALTIRKANGLHKNFTPQLAIENVTQAAARNALCEGLEQLAKLGYSDVIHIHDEAFLIVDKNRASVLHAREALLKVFGPGHTLSCGWAALVKPKEISVTESMWEEEADFDPTKGNRWGRIEQNEPDCLENLP